MKKIEEGIVFSNDIKKILNGENAYDYKYEYVPSDKTIEDIRENFKKDIQKIFEKYTIITEQEMLEVNKLIGGEYPHCNIG